MIYDFGMLIKQLRKEKGWSQQQLANKLQVTKAAVSTYERNIRTPSAEILKTMAVIFNVSANYLLGLKEPSSLHTEHLTEEQKQILENISNEFRRLNR